VAVLALLAALVVGCGGSHADVAKTTPPHPPDGAPSLTTDLRLTKRVPCLEKHQHLAGPKTLEHFHAVTAVICGRGIRSFPGQGLWKVKVRRVAVSSVAALQKYFEQASKTGEKKSTCSANAGGILVPVFVDAHGHWLAPRTPVDACNHPLGVGSYGKGVRWQDVRVHGIEPARIF
jgi:hypothetical protein